MIYRIYPYVLFACCMAWWLALASCISLFTSSAWWQLLPPIPSIWLGLSATTLIASRFPKMHYVNEAEIDGLGYVHPPIGPILLALLTQIMAVIAIISQSMA